MIKNSNKIVKTVLNNQQMNKYFNPDHLLAGGEGALKLIVDEYKDIERKDVVPDVKPGFLRNLLPENPPSEAESIENILEDTKKFIIPGLTQWQHPNFYAYFPANMSHGAIVGDMISVAFNTPGFTWVASPASTELENIVVDWIVKCLGLPEKFLLKNTGGGTIANTIGDAIFLSVHAAKFRKVKELGIELHDPRILKLVGYYTGISHSQNEKGLFMKDIPYRRQIPIYFNEEIQNYQIRPEEFEEMVKKDISEGLIPFWCGSTLGSTSLGCNDPIPEVSKICKKYNIFLNVDAAWAGAALVVPELREELGKGLEEADSMAINFGKWNMCGGNSALFYVADKSKYREALLGGPIPEYLKNQFTNEHDIIDYKDWQIGLGRRFNSLRIWFMMRSVGVEGMKQNILEKIELAKEFEKLLEQDSQFEKICKRELSLLCFRIIKDPKGQAIPEDKINEVNKKLLESINDSREYHLVGSIVENVYFLRFVVCNHNTTVDHIQKAWADIKKLSSTIFEA